MLDNCPRATTKPTASGTLGTLYRSTLALMFSIKFDPRTGSWNVVMGHATYAMFQCRYEAEVLAETLTAQENLFPEAFYHTLPTIEEMSGSIPHMESGVAGVEEDQNTVVN
jgi:hypothetical protein